MPGLSVHVILRPRAHTKGDADLPKFYRGYRYAIFLVGRFK